MERWILIRWKGCPSVRWNKEKRCYSLSSVLLLYFCFLLVKIYLFIIPTLDQGHIHKDVHTLRKLSFRLTRSSKADWLLSQEGLRYTQTLFVNQIEYCYSNFPLCVDHTYFSIQATEKYNAGMHWPILDFISVFDLYLWYAFICVFLYLCCRRILYSIHIW